MKKQSAKWLQAMSYLIGAFLFFIGAARLLVREDVIGAVICSFAGLFAVFMIFLSVSKGDANTG